tara:strand:- start:235 stop:363 length:129 start_codon:yes stop_codon:yes gene_type:complete
MKMETAKLTQPEPNQATAVTRVLDYSNLTPEPHWTTKPAMPE